MTIINPDEIVHIVILLQTYDQESSAFFVFNTATSLNLSIKTIPIDTANEDIVHYSEIETSNNRSYPETWYTHFLMHAKEPSKRNTEKHIASEGENCSVTLFT